MGIEVFSGKRVLITGHTGFKGTWLTAWLHSVGAKICGISKDIPTSPSMFEILNLEKDIEHHLFDICESKRLNEVVRTFNPDFIFHLAAQALVSVSYEDPIDTIKTNVVGTASILQCLTEFQGNCTAIIITSDKCYENVEWEWGYKETDRLGGKDIYSGSKGAAEIILHAYIESFLKNKTNIKIASARAGNVIGGGDWAKDRIVPDCIKSWLNNVPVTIRCPDATRPWQHVLEPLSGYLALAIALSEDTQSPSKLNHQAFNFGPRNEQNKTVLELISELANRWGIEDQSDAFSIVDRTPFHEAGLLKLNCDKAMFHLSWQPNLEYEECIDFVSDWYVEHYQKESNMRDFTLLQIMRYQEYANKRAIAWAQK
ncbi:CDP-glucose 4,6-dehydratase [Alteromonas portus]|uniref:CDP-glucose 4,6-dehydratase n=1 Tax=Alteromonas portus TaxID=2565549 RepID=A0A4U0ZS38_9ALTE|nr:CDP-glucose 4,6-dehydratase [Alteromonas portus]TKB05201.1 CDP-glucose 4,6-dehydratase [Alteromonas portus]